jgi:ADP-ribose pyrophosphatase
VSSHAALLTALLSKMTANKSPMKPWQVLASNVLIDRRPWLHVIEQNVRLPNGHIIEGYLLAQDRDFSMILALTDDGRVPLVQQYKHGPRRLVYDLPAGYVDEGESPLTCAQRELLEETGYAASEWRHLGSFLLNTNRNCDRTHLYLATDARLVAQPHLDDAEDIMLKLCTPDQLTEMIHSGEIETLATAAGVMLGLDALRER